MMHALNRLCQIPCALHSCSFLKSSLLALLVFCLINTPNVAASEGESVLPDAVLRHVLYVEPNFHLRQLGNVSSTPSRLKRTFLDAGHRRAAGMIQRYMRAAGMVSWIDPVGNVRGRAPAANPDAPAMFVGSHYDSVVDGGIFDGAMGIIAGIAAVKALILETSIKAGLLTARQLLAEVEVLENEQNPAADLTLHFSHLLPPRTHASLLQRPVEVVAFADEEGVRFQTTFLGSRALAGTLLTSGAMEQRDSQGQTLSDALMAVGMEGTEIAISSAALDPGAAAGYVEVHLEQGPVLEATGKPLGVVGAIAGQSRLVIHLYGEQGHAGTVPMRLRRDPLAGASELMMNIERLCKEIAMKKGPGGDSSLVCTVGSLSVWPGAVNVIPGAANFTLDVRSQSDEIRDLVLEKIREHVELVCKNRGLTCEIEVRHQVKAVPCSKDLVSQLADAVEQTTRHILPRLEQASETSWNFNEKPQHRGNSAPPIKGHQCSGQGESVTTENGQTTCAAADRLSDFVLPTVKTSSGGQVPLLASGAGHDGMAIADISPVGMLFVRCHEGISHSPAEWVDPADVALGTAALLQFLHNWEEAAQK